MDGHRPHFIILDEALEPPRDVMQRSCWSIWEGCVCRHLKDHFGSHGCDDPNCRSTWTTEQAEEWVAAERIGRTVTDRHRTRDSG